MSFRINLGLGLLAVTVFGTFTSPSAEAASADCMSADGECEVTNDPEDFITCECAGGAGTGGTGGNDWEGLSDDELQPICEGELEGLCGGGPPPPPPGVFCEGAQGFCVVDNEPEDSVFCECLDGSGGGGAGGMEWAGLSDDELEEVCFEQLPEFCGGMAGLPCGTENGSCIISNEPFDSINCECTDGEGFGFGGGMDWAELSNDELTMVCEELVDLECDGDPPPPLQLECSNDLGTCGISNDPFDSIECECVNGDEPAAGGGNEWAEQSEEELLMTCEEELNVLCADDASSESTTTNGEPTTGVGSSSSTGEPGTTTDVEPGSTTEVEPGTTTEVEPGTTSGVEGSGTSGGPGGNPSTTGGDPDGSTSSGGADGADGGSGGCSVTTERPSGGWSLMLLGLLGLGWRLRLGA